MSTLHHEIPATTPIPWLLDGDPAIRWQALRDLTDAPATEVAAERTRVAREGWGAELLAAQRPSGTWAEPDHGWMIAMRTLSLLKDMGAEPADPAVRAAIARVRPLTFVWNNNRLFFDGETEACINGRILGLGAYFGEPSRKLLEQLLSEQLGDGGWNCEAPASSRSSFHSTICVLEGLAAWEQAMGKSPEVSAARQRGDAYLLDRHLFRGLRSGDIVDNRFTAFGFHPNWEYDLLRGLDYFRAAGVVPDPRMAEAIDIVRRRADEDGRWPLDRLGQGPVGYVTESEVGAPSQWNTLRALRVLRWWEQGAAESPA